MFSEVCMMTYWCNMALYIGKVYAFEQSHSLILGEGFREGESG